MTGYPPDREKEPTGSADELRRDLWSDSNDAAYSGWEALNRAEELRTKVTKDGLAQIDLAKAVCCCLEALRLEIRAAGL